MAGMRKALSGMQTRTKVAGAVVVVAVIGATAKLS